MKKTYTTPRTKAVKVQESAIICTSPGYMTINNDLGDEYKKGASAW